MKKSTKIIIAVLAIAVVGAVAYAMKYYVSDATNDQESNANQLAQI